MKRTERLVLFLTYLVLSVGGFLILVPLWFQITTSLKPFEDVFLFPPDIIPRTILWENYVNIFQLAPMGRFILNSLFVSTLTGLGQVLSSAFVGYGFAKLRFPGREVLFLIMISTMMIPFHSILIPQFIIFRNLGWINTYLPLIVPGWFGTPLYIFLFRQFFINIPMDYNEAATIDGCGYFSAFIRIIIPMSLPVVGTVAILAFTTSWNDFLAPLVYIHDLNMMTIQLGVQAFTGRFATLWHYTMAASVVALIPTVIIFAFFQKRMIQGVVVSGIKG